ncbi:MAG TPA: hypothetical protein VFE98_06750 [Candidatus Bathyarchaeia archaeon]|nr:hypothetical protein [Candidatus Bathyarchaeia archaeon]
MKKQIVIIGVVLLVVGFAAAGYFISVEQAMHLRTYGTLGLGIVGLLVAVGGALMRSSTAVAKGQLTCDKCGATFASQGALDQHSRDKHSMKPSSQP